MLDLILVLGVVVWSTVGAIYFNYRRKHRKFDISGTSVLITYYTEGVELVPLQSGKLGDLNFTAIATTLKTQNNINSRPALIYRVELPFHSKVHLLGIPKQNGVEQLNPAGSNSVLERVSLEGDYDNYFTLYAEKGMQTQSRYVLDPKAMAFTIDFCRSHNWEILGGDLYFIQASGQASGDPTAMANDIVPFVAQIRSSIEVPLTAEELQLRTPYKEERRTNLKCPICSQFLNSDPSYLACPKGDGFLVQGGVLSQINRGTVRLPIANVPPHSPRSQPLTCPSCGNKTEEVAYNGGKTIIDSCKHCLYRWIDTGELNKSEPN